MILVVSTSTVETSKYSLLTIIQYFWELSAFSVSKRLYGVLCHQSTANLEMSLCELFSTCLLPLKFPFLEGRLACYRISVTLSFPAFETNFPSNQYPFVSTDGGQMRTQTMPTTVSLEEARPKPKETEHITVVCHIGLQHCFLVGPAV